jgi:hypothetical protein
MSDKHAFIYVDDSGDDEIGVSMSALLLPAEEWSTCLGYWTETRTELQERYGLPKHFEIHSNAFLSAHPLKDLRARAAKQASVLASREEDPVLDAIAIARAQLELSDLALDRALAVAESAGKTMLEISSAARLNAPDVFDRLGRSRSIPEFESIECLSGTPGSRTTRRKIYNQLLDQINSLPGAQVVTVCANDGKKGTMGRVYEELLRIVGELLVKDERWGTVVVDGTPSARTAYYRDAHRNLELGARRILEDEVLRDSSESHFIQMADICAHSAFGLRQGKGDERYLRLKRVIVTADGEEVGPGNHGFFVVHEEERT